MASKPKLPQKLLQALNNTKSKSQFDETLKAAIEQHQDAAIQNNLRSYGQNVYDSQAKRASQFLRNSNARSLPLEARQAYLNDFNKMSDWSTSVQKQQAQEQGRRHEEMKARIALQSTRNIADPQARMSQRSQIINSYSSSLSDKNKVIVDAQVANRNDAARLERQALMKQKNDEAVKLAQERQKERDELNRQKSGMSNLRTRAEGYTAGRSLEIDSINSRGGSPSAKIDLLNATKTGEFNSKILEKIDKSIQAQTEIIKKDVSRADELRKNSPVLSRVFSGSLGGPKSLSEEQAISMSKKISLTRGIAGGLVAGGGALFDVVNGAQQARNGSELRTFGLLSGIQAKNANMAISGLTGYSGSDLFQRYGDVIGGASNASRLFSGGTGLKRSAVEGAKVAKEERDLQAKAAIKDALFSGAAGIGTIIAGAGISAASFGAATPIGIGVAAAGAAQLGKAVSGFINNKDVNSYLSEKGLYTPSNQLAAEGSAQVAARGRSLADGARTQDLERNKLTVAALDATMEYRQTQLQNLRSGVAYSSQVDLKTAGDRRRTFGVSAGGSDELANMNNQAQLIKRDLLESGAAGGRLGVNAATFDSMVTSAGLAMGPGYRGGSSGRANTAVMAEELSRSGRGSFEQILGNISALNKVGGKADSSKELERIMSKAVGLGFDNSKLAQEFVDRAVSATSGAGLTDTDRLTGILSRASSLMGGGERGLQMAERGAAGINAFIPGNARASAIQQMGYGEALKSLNLGANDKRTAYAGRFMDQFAELNTQQQGEFLGGSKDPKYQFLRSLMSDIGVDDKSEFMQSLKGSREKALFGGLDIRKYLGQAKGALDGKNGKNDARKIISNDVISAIASQSGMTTEAAAFAVSEFIGQNKEFAGLGGVVQGAAKDAKAISRFNSLNKFNALRAAGENALNAMGESNLGETLMQDLVKGTLSGKASSVSALLAQGSTLGTGLKSSKIAGMIDSEDERGVLSQMITMQNKGVGDKALKDFAEKNKGSFGADIKTDDIVAVSKALSMSKESSILLNEKSKADAWQQAGIQTVRIDSQSIKELAFGIAGAKDGNLESYNQTLKNAMGN